MLTFFPITDQQTCDLSYAIILQTCHTNDIIGLTVGGCLTSSGK